MNKIIKSIPKLPKRYFLIFLIALSFGGWLLWSQNKNAEAPILILAKKHDIKVTVSASGTLQGKQNANLHFKSSGKLAYLPVEVGQTVSRFQTIAGLDTQDLAATLQQAQNDYRSKQSSAEKALDETKDHSKDETFTQKETRTKAEAARDSAYDAVKIAQFSLNNSYIPSPFNGIITELNFSPGQFVTSADTIAKVVDWSEVVFESEVDESDISKIEIGQTAEVELNSYPDLVFLGTVSEISPNTKTNSSGATVVVVKISLGTPNIKLISDLNGQATITISETKNVLSLPVDVVADDQIYILQDNKQTPVKVSTGARNDEYIEITSGLNETQQVIKNPKKAQ